MEIRTESLGDLSKSKNTMNHSDSNNQILEKFPKPKKPIVSVSQTGCLLQNKNTQICKEKVHKKRACQFHN